MWAGTSNTNTNQENCYTIHAALQISRMVYGLRTYVRAGITRAESNGSVRSVLSWPYNNENLRSIK